MKCEQFEPVLKPVTLHKLSPKEYRLAKEKFVRDNIIPIDLMCNGYACEFNKGEAVRLFRKQFSYQGKRQTFDKIILTVKTIYKKLYV